MGSVFSVARNDMVLSIGIGRPAVTPRSGATPSLYERRESLMTGRATHGDTRGRSTTAEFRTWCAMRQRCYNENAHNYARYGGRGITVCKRWRESYEAFLQDMGRKPSAKHSLDRIDNDGNYTPKNCRWATLKQQAKNRRPMKKQTHCAQGHPYSGSNLYTYPNGNRRCKKCDRSQAERRRNAKP